ncbi:MAG: double zinc ribbon domain-containing protein [Crocinitomicaceae bacterium]
MKPPNIKAKDFLDYFFPIRCLVCQEITNQENTLCMKCSSKLKFSQAHLNFQENELTELFHGRIHLDRAYFHLRNDSEGMAKKLIHQIKYNSNFELIDLLGKSVKEKLKNEFDHSWILPVPLNPKKEKQRGYNQSEKIAQSIFQKDQILNNLVKRELHTKSQTGFGKFQRWSNMENAFQLNEEVLNEIGENDSLTIVDDVVTTGSTVEAIFVELKKCKPNLNFSLFTLLKA